MSQKKDLTFVHDMLAKLDSRLDDIYETQIKQQCILEEHQRRSVANEQAVEILAKELKPVTKHVDMMTYIGRFLLGIVAMLALIATIWQAIK